MKALIDQQPDITLWEIRERLNLDCTLPAIHYVIRDMGMSFKKTLHASEQGREDVKLARAEWIAMQGQLDIVRLVFIDEAGAKTNMTRLYGRSPKDVRAYDHAPHGHWCTTTMISSIRSNGETACMAVDAATSGDVFRAYVEHVLVPTLRKGDIVVLDNLSAHKDKLTLQLIENVGAEVWFLPPYSPDLNPIEKMWSKVKQLLRGTKARTHESLLDAIGVALGCVSETDALGWFASCGYSLS